MVERAHDVLRRPVYDWRRYLGVIQRKPGALRNGALLAEMPKAFRRLQARLLQRPGGDPEMVDILLVCCSTMSRRCVLCAVEVEFQDGVATTTQILNVLHRLTDGGAAAAIINAPQALMLRQEPKAEISVYDALRDREAR